MSRIETLDTYQVIEKRDIREMNSKGWVLEHKMCIRDRYYIGHTPEDVRMAVPKEEGGIKKGMFVLGTAITMLDDEVVLLQEKLRK